MRTNERKIKEKKNENDSESKSVSEIENKVEKMKSRDKRAGK